MRAGEASDGGPLYVGRAHHEGGLFPGKVILYNLYTNSFSVHAMRASKLSFDRVYINNCLKF